MVRMMRLEGAYALEDCLFVEDKYYGELVAHIKAAGARGVINGTVFYKGVENGYLIKAESSRDQGWISLRYSEVKFDNI